MAEKILTTRKHISEGTFDPLKITSCPTSDWYWYQSRCFASLAICHGKLCNDIIPTEIIVFNHLFSQPFHLYRTLTLKTTLRIAKLSPVDAQGVTFILLANSKLASEASWLHWVLAISSDIFPTSDKIGTCFKWSPLCLPLCSPRKTSLNFRRGLPNSPPPVVVDILTKISS